MARKPTAALSRNPDISTQYSRERYAHPFFLPAPPEARTPINGHTRMTQWSMTGLGPVPPVKGNGVFDLADIIGAQGVAEVQQLGEIRFHALGDSGVNHATRAEEVADDMATDFKAGAGAMNPSFLFHLGDIVYGTGKDEHYVERFYRPYRHYPGKILAIPGNHDGESISPADEPSLKAYIANFCAKTAAVPPPVASVGIFRETMMQPGAYWMLDAPFVRIIGLYSNRLENPGFLEGDGGNDKTQLTWLGSTLKSIAKNKTKKALVIAAHHPPFSSAGHEGSTKMMESIDTLCQAAGLFPDAFLSAHAHNYQRYTRRIAGKQIPYIVCGTGGISPQRVPDASGQPVEGSPGTTYDGAMKSYGYLYVTASPHSLKFEFWPLTDGGHADAFDPITVNLDTHVVSSG